MRRAWTMSLASAMAVLILANTVAGATSADGKRTIRLAQAWAQGPLMSGLAAGGGARGNGAVYMTIRNLGTEADALLSAASDVSDKVELREVVGDAGVMKVTRPVSRVVIPAEGKVEMRPGGLHVALFRLRRDLNRGDKIKIVLTFEKAGLMSFEAPVL